jgi:hypothetical protein
VRGVFSPQLYDDDVRNQAFKSGTCIMRFAFTNPIWAITRPTGGVRPSHPPRGIDTDGDGLPDGCDACPLTKECWSTDPTHDHP